MEEGNMNELISPMSETENPSLNDIGKYCLIVKRPDFDGYGFNLHSEKAKPGQYIGKVDADSPAEAAGLREGDRIIEVNGVYIGEETHKQVVQRIKAISNEVRLLLIDVNSKPASYSSKDQANIPKEKTVPSEGIKSVNSNTKSVSIVPKEQTTLLSNPTAIVGSTTSSDQKENDCNKNLISTEIKTFSNKQNSSLNVVDSASNETNGQHTNSNGQTTALVSTTTANSLLEHSQRRSSTQQHPLEDATTNKSSLNLNVTAAEMRARLLAKKKFDPKAECVDLKKKFDIIQKL